MSIRLTQTVQKGGCAAKISAHVLREILSSIEFPPQDPNLIVDTKTFDDAAIYRMSDELALVQTLDFFTPIVDTPKIFGRIAAVNALSDVYAMGGIPKTCMAILAFPLSTLEQNIATEVIQGAVDAIKEAKASLAGGHSIDDDTLKFGLSVTGFVNPKKMWANSTAQAGDMLILTKPLGTGTLTAGLKRSVYTESDIGEAILSMQRLNNVIDFLTPNHLNAIHSATDITGFGLAGHGMQMADASTVTFEVNTAKLPLFDLSIESLKKEHLTKAHKSNAHYTEKKNFYSSTLRLEEKLITYDPQTSGGLLLSVSPESANSLCQHLQTFFPKTCIIGEVKNRESFSVKFN